MPKSQPINPIPTKCTPAIPYLDLSYICVTFAFFYGIVYRYQANVQCYTITQPHTFITEIAFTLVTKTLPALSFCTVFAVSLHLFMCNSTKRIRIHYSGNNNNNNKKLISISIPISCAPFLFPYISLLSLFSLDLDYSLFALFQLLVFGFLNSIIEINRCFQRQRLTFN